MKNLTLLFVTSSFVFGCASKVTSEKVDLKNANNIAVISVMDAPTSPTANTDQVITDEMLSSLKNSNKKAFALLVENSVVKAERDQATALKDVYLGNRYQNLEKYFLTEATTQNADYLLVIHPAPHPQYSTYSPGYGFYCELAQNQNELQGYFMMSSELWDVKKQEIVSKVTLSPADLSFKTGKKCKEAVTSKDLLNSYKGDILSLAKKSSAMILNRTGILN